jgi:dsRNA-specific ribonuclease
MTSNRFLSAIGEPTKVEAEIGNVYSRDGQEAAFRFIEQQLLPVFERQEKNRTARMPAKRKS